MFLLAMLACFPRDSGSLLDIGCMHSAIQKRAHRSGHRAASGVSRHLQCTFDAFSCSVARADARGVGRYRVDRAESLNALRLFLKRKSDMIDEESRWLRLVKTDCVLSDAAFLGWYVSTYFTF